MSDQAITTNVEAELKKQLAELDGQLGTAASNKISTSGKLFTLPTGESSPGPLRAVILDFVWYMAHYPKGWDADDPGEPDCWAMGRDKPESGFLAPHAQVQQPYAEYCALCPKNRWGSGRGDAKACKNSRRLVIVPPDATDRTEPATLYVSPTGLKRFDLYAKGLAHLHGLHPLQVVTDIAFDPRPTYPTLVFDLVGPHENTELMWRLRERAQEQLWKSLPDGGARAIGEGA